MIVNCIGKLFLETNRKCKTMNMKKNLSIMTFCRIIVQKRIRQLLKKLTAWYTFSGSLGHCCNLRVRILEELDYGPPNVFEEAPFLRRVFLSAQYLLVSSCNRCSLLLFNFIKIEDPIAIYRSFD